jgi:hypothetical protein
MVLQMSILYTQDLISIYKVSEKNYLKKVCDSKSLSNEILGLFTWIIKNPSWVLVAYAYNPSYSRGRDQEDHGLRPAWGKKKKKKKTSETLSQKSQHKTMTSRLG